MKRLHLDFIAPPRRLHSLGWLLLLLGLLLLGGLLAFERLQLAPRAQQLSQDMGELRTQLSPTTTRSTLKPEELAASWKKAQAVSDQLQLPWNRLFASMGEASADKSLAFLSIEPDAQKGQVVVMAEARDLKAMLRFLRAMQAREDFTDVSLQSHLINRAVPEKPVRFRLSARWKVKP